MSYSDACFNLFVDRDEDPEVARREYLMGLYLDDDVCPACGKHPAWCDDIDACDAAAAAAQLAGV